MASIIFAERYEVFRGYRVYCASWSPKTAPRANLAMIHGLGEHCVRYDNYFRRIANDCGVAIHAFDQTGHGKTEGPRGHAEMDIAFEVVDKLFSQAEPSVPRLLYGHSMGGGMALRYASQKGTVAQLAGVIASAPAVGTEHPPSKFLRAVVGFISKFMPKFAISNGLALENISRDPEEIKKYQEDPLVHNKVSLKCAVNLFNNCDWLAANGKELSVPLLLLHGDADKLTDPKASQRYFPTVSSEDKTLEILPGYFHEIHNEPEEYRENVIAIVESWINKATSSDTNTVQVVITPEEANTQH